MCRFLHKSYPGHERVVEASGAIVDNMQGLAPAKESKRRLELHLWQPAFDAYTLAAAILDQFGFKAAQAHKAIVLEQAFTAEAAGQGTLVGVLYDEFARHVFVVCACAACALGCALYTGWSGMTSLRSLAKLSLWRGTCQSCRQMHLGGLRTFMKSLCRDGRRVMLAFAFLAVHACVLCSQGKGKRPASDDWQEHGGQKKGKGKGDELAAGVVPAKGGGEPKGTYA